MGRGAERYSDDQREAIVRAVLEQGMTDKATVAAAERGELDGLEPFDVPASTVRYLVGKAQQQSITNARGQLRALPDLDPLGARGRDLYERCADALELQVERLAAAAADRDFTREDFDTLRAFERAVKELVLGARQVAHKRPAHPGETELDGGEDPPSPAMVSLLAKHRDDQRAAQASP